MLTAAAETFSAEQRKLWPGADQLARDRALSPWTLGFVVLGRLIAGIATLFRIVRP